ncbi:MAG: regulatory iron-sulfur-containing complex subunit RicT [bacterium]|jgi:cell fate regulator YaaT (PSP1 superfamily)|nr:regulatory iron-sulfur-containing complex subunit RicT [bacterium]
MKIIEVKVRDARTVARFRVEEESAASFEPTPYCLVEHDGDLELAKIKSPLVEWKKGAPPENETYYLRSATQEDLDVFRDNRLIEREAFDLCLNKIRERDLPMALATVERAFDGKKLRFYFTAEQRIDFRELVKDLAHVYKTRIEMRQIGVRDRAKKIGGYSVCGQELCCSRFLQKFDPITIRMAKDQNLALNPTKISGLCGRLMCCLAYEVDSYQCARKEFPPMGTRVRTEFGEGTILDMNYVKNTINVKIEEDSNRVVECAKGEYEILKAAN